MLRGLVAALLVANLLALAWTLGWFEALPGGGRHPEREPERIERQVNPDAVQLIAPMAASAALQAAAVRTLLPAAPPASAAAGDAVASKPDAPRPVCLEAGPFAAAEVAGAERGLRELQWPGLGWVNVKSERGGLFMVYLGRFADDAAMTKRRDELRRLQIAVDELRSSPALQPGLTFGRFDSQAAANDALEQLAQRGVKNARVVTLVAPVVVTLLRVERADAALAARLSQLSLPPAGSGFKTCATTP
jgi:hypothetical protein